jgi:hypothetical protein
VHCQGKNKNYGPSRTGFVSAANTKAMKHTMATVKQILAMSASERDALNQSILSTLTNVPCAAVEFHAAQLKNWQVNKRGPKPTPEMVKFNYIIDGGRRAGDEPMWLALTLRPNGATVGEYMNATDAGGAAHNNACKYNTERSGGAGWLVRVPLPNDTRAGRWQHVITDKGAAQLAKRVAALTGAADAKPVKATKPVKVARKRNKATEHVTVDLPDSAAVARETYVDNALDAANQGVASDAQLAVLAAKFNG